MSTPLDDLFDQFPVHLSVANLSAVLGVTLKTAYEYLQTNQIPCYRIGSRWMVLRDEVKEFIKISARQPLITTHEPPPTSPAPQRDSQASEPEPLAAKTTTRD